MAHLLAVSIENLFRRKKSPKGLPFAAGAACLALTFGFILINHKNDPLREALREIGYPEFVVDEGC